MTAMVVEAQIVVPPQQPEEDIKLPALLINSIKEEDIRAKLLGRKPPRTVNMNPTQPNLDAITVIRKQPNRQPHRPTTNLPLIPSPSPQPSPPLAESLFSFCLGLIL